MSFSPRLGRERVFFLLSITRNFVDCQHFILVVGCVNLFCHSISLGSVPEDSCSRIIEYEFMCIFTILKSFEGILGNFVVTKHSSSILISQSLQTSTPKFRLFSHKYYGLNLFWHFKFDIRF